MSRSRQSLPFSKYSLSPERNRRRVTTISPARNCCWLNLRRRILSTTWGAPFRTAEVATGTTEWTGNANTGSSSGKATARMFTFACRISTSSGLPGWASSTARSVSSAARARMAASSQSSAGRRAASALTGSSSWMSISVGASASGPGYSSGSISVSDTSAMPVGLRSRVPAKITSSMRDPRSVLADCSPSTQEMASAIFDLPQPLGPMMAAIPSPWNLRSVRSQNDLKPRI